MIETMIFDICGPNCEELVLGCFKADFRIQKSEKTHFSAFFEIYRIYTLFNVSISILNFQDFRKFFRILMICPGICKF